MSDKPLVPDALEMSDEDFLKMPASAFDGPPLAAAENNTDADDDDNDDDDAGDSANADEKGKAPASADPAAGAAQDDDDDTDDKGKAAGQDAVKDPAADETKASEKPAEEAAEKKDVPPAGELTDAQYVEIGKQVMSEFKANGRAIKLKSADDAIQLMQMGANYHKKMAGLKPSLKTLKLLENHGLLDPVKLNYLIDLSQKKPEAITQLLKDSKIDPMDIDLEGQEKYVPNQRTVNDTELVLDEILDSISHSPSYNKTLTVLGDEWDTASRAIIAKDPEVIRTINAHMENGVYDQVANAVAYERSLGKLTGVSDYDAYSRIGTYMHENNLFKTAAVPPRNPQKPEPQKQGETAEEIEQRKNRKKAASPSRQNPAGVPDKSKYNPLEMSDEEFIKLNKLSL